MILRDGFRDGTGNYMLVGFTLTGVLLADRPVDSNEGAQGDQVLAVELGDDVRLDEFELVEDGASLPRVVRAGRDSEPTRHGAAAR